MSKRNEDSIERFFRKAASQHDSSHMERDWQKMEKLLDDEANKVAATKFHNMKRGFLTGTVVTGIVAIIYFLSTQQHPETRLLTDGSLVQKQAVASAEAPVLEQKENQATATLFSESNVEQNNNAVVSRSNEEVTAKPRIGRQPQQNSFEIGQQDVLLNANISEEKAVLRNEGAVENQSNVSSDKTFENERLVHNASSVVEEEKKSEEEKLVKEEEPETLTEEKQQEEKEESKPGFSRWIVSLNVAPDFSTTALNGYTTPGGAFGISIGFNILRRLSITSGIIRTTKKYVGYGSEYQPPKGYWKYKTNGVVPDEITGNCAILEVPLTVQYDVKQSTRNRIFIAAGISSYRMLSEAYHYEFEQPNPGASNNWSSSEPSSYLFSIGHLSAGYERMITPRISLGVEPFLKVPFAGIGWTDIRLYTTGAYFNLRYRFSKNLEHVSKN